MSDYYPMTDAEALRVGRPFELGSRTLRNRVVFAPMDRNYCDTQGRLTDRYIEYLAERAAGGAALVFPEAAYVRIDGKCQTHQMGLHDDEIVPGLRRLADRVHEHGGLLGVQLNHGGNTAKPKVSGYRPVSPSGVPCRFVGGFEPDVLDPEDIEMLVEDYAAAAARSVAAGVDVVTIHAAHGYLIHQFMMRRTNLREDEFGDPTRFLDAMIAAVAAAVPDTPLVLRLTAHDNPANGLDDDEALAVVKRANLGPISLLDVSAGSYEAAEWIIPVGERPQGWLAETARRYAGLGPAVSVAGRIATLEAAEEILAGGGIDLLSVARALHADPDWAAPLLGREVAPRPCIACNLCIDELGAGPIRCTVNPRAGLEGEIAADGPPVPIADPGRTLIVGAGPAGLELARRLSLAGRRVRLVDREERIGGQFALAAHLRCYPEYHRILDWYGAQLERLGVEPELGVELDLDDLAAGDYDDVVIASGGVGYMPGPVEAAPPWVADVRDWLREGAPVEGGRFLVWGGDREAVAVADQLIGDGAAVTMVVAGERFSRDAGRMAKALVIERLRESERAELLFSSQVTAVDDSGVRLATPAGERLLEPPTRMLVSQGVEADGLARAARKLDPRFRAVGDAAGQGGGFPDALAGSVELARTMISEGVADALT
jgi:2,4-dienoyl-CoA reductase-like NADH-dependent reductase (Old Yellow Enzyme family)/thioredoxin reductase